MPKDSLIIFMYRKNFVAHVFLYEIKYQVLILELSGINT
nr:MAG TPA: hypothetical protein [Caudoviricetes sp.]